MMRNIRLNISYDGSAYAGFQIQPNGDTIQSRLQHAITAVTGEETKITSSGRTDAGVHALCQVVNFRTSSTLPLHRWCRALNAHLPRDIIVWHAAEVSDLFHARKSAISKTYCYTINGNRCPDVMQQHQELHHPGKLQIEAMRTAAADLIGEHDFTSFTTVRSDKRSHVRIIYKIEIEKIVIPHKEQFPGQGKFRIIMKGNGFLYHMVRIIAGTLLQIGEGKLAPEDMRRILDAKDRTKAGPTAKPHGLTLWNVQYPHEFG